MKIYLHLFTLLLICLFPKILNAQFDDYTTLNLQNTNWNGLSDFYKLAQNTQCNPTILNNTPLNPSPNDTIILINPKHISINQLYNWLAANINILLFEDNNASNLLQNLNPPIISTKSLPKNLPCINNNPNLPVITINSQNPILKNVTNIALNHPSFANSELTPFIAINKNYALAYDLSSKNASLFIFLDASILTNLMLNTLDNKTLIQNLLKQKCTQNKKLFIITEEINPKTEYKSEFHRFIITTFKDFNFSYILIPSALLLIFCLILIKFPFSSPFFLNLLKSKNF